MTASSTVNHRGRSLWVAYRIADGKVIWTAAKTQATAAKVGHLCRMPGLIEVPTDAISVFETAGCLWDSIYTYSRSKSSFSPCTLFNSQSVNSSAASIIRRQEENDAAHSSISRYVLSMQQSATA